MNVSSAGNFCFFVCCDTQSPLLCLSPSNCTVTVAVTVGLLLSTSRCSPTRAAHAVVQPVGSPGYLEPGSCRAVDCVPVRSTT